MPLGRSGALALLAVGVAQTLLVLSVAPYPISFYNPLLGGAQVARNTLELGWGEGIDQVAAYLAEQPEASRLVVSTLYWDLLPAQFPGLGAPLWEWQEADYLLDYVNMEQRGILPLPLQQEVRDGQPVFTARINGIDYARLYAISAQARVADSAGGKRAIPRPGAQLLPSPTASRDNGAQRAGPSTTAGGQAPTLLPARPGQAELIRLLDGGEN